METETRTSEASSKTDWKKWGLKAVRGVYFTIVVMVGGYFMQTTEGSMSWVWGAVTVGAVYAPTYLRQRRQKLEAEPKEDEPR